MELLSSIKSNLVKLVKFRQNSICIIYIKYKHKFPEVIEELCRNIIEQEVSVFTFQSIELEIEGFVQLVDSNKGCNWDMTTEIIHMLNWSEQEFNALLQTYTSNYEKINRLSKKFPWNLFYKIFDVKKIELID